MRLEEGNAEGYEHMAKGHSFHINSIAGISSIVERNTNYAKSGASAFMLKLLVYPGWFDIVIDGYATNVFVCVYSRILLPLSWISVGTGG